MHKSSVLAEGLATLLEGLGHITTLRDLTLAVHFLMPAASAPRFHAALQRMTYLTRLCLLVPEIGADGDHQAAQDDSDPEWITDQDNAVEQMMGTPSRYPRSCTLYLMGHTLRHLQQLMCLELTFCIAESAFDQVVYMMRSARVLTALTKLDFRKIGAAYQERKRAANLTFLAMDAMDNLQSLQQLHLEVPFSRTSENALMARYLLASASKLPTFPITVVTVQVSYSLWLLPVLLGILRDDSVQTPRVKMLFDSAWHVREEDIAEHLPIFPSVQDLEMHAHVDRSFVDKLAQVPAAVPQLQNLQSFCMTGEAALGGSAWQVLESVALLGTLQSLKVDATPHGAEAEDPGHVQPDCSELFRRLRRLTALTELQFVAPLNSSAAPIFADACGALTQLKVLEVRADFLLHDAGHGLPHWLRLRQRVSDSRSDVVKAVGELRLRKLALHGCQGHEKNIRELFMRLQHLRRLHLHGASQRFVDELTQVRDQVLFGA